MSMDFRILSDSLEADELAGYFMQFLDENKDKSATLDSLKQLYELAYRQWDTYEKLNENISQKVEAYLISAINYKSYDIMDTIISIVGNLSLKNVFSEIISNKDNVSSPDIKRLINDAEEEYADTIGNPYDDFDDWL